MKKLLFLIAISIVATHVLSQTTYYVSSTGTNSGTSWTTIKGAITVASSGDIIQVSPGTYTEKNITLNAVKSLTIKGAGMSQTIIQADATTTVTQSNDCSVFKLDGTYTAGIVITIQDMTVQNGYNAFSGGGIRIVNAGSQSDAPTLNLKNLKIANNRGAFGGGVYVQGGVILNIDKCYITSNTVTSSSNSGGGIAISPTAGFVANATIKNSTIAGNSSAGHGGGISVICGTNGSLAAANSLWIENTTLYRNSITTSAKIGGGIYFRTCTSGQSITPTFNLTLNHCTIVSNSTIAGSTTSTSGPDGVAIETSGGYATTIVMNNSIIMGNTGSTGSNACQIGTNNTSTSSTALGKITNGGITNSIFGIISGGTWATSSTNNNLSSSISDLAFSASLSSDATPVLKIGSASIAKDYVVTNYLSPELSIDQLGNSRVGKTDAGAYEYGTSQTISFISSSKTYGDADFTPAIASSGLTVTYASTNASVASIVNGQIHIVGVGTSTITASQAGDAATYYPAPQVSQVLTVTPKVLTAISSPYTANKTYDGTTTATINGAFAGIVGSDAVNLTGNFADANLGTAKSVIATSTLGGVKASNYIYTGSLPTGLNADITPILSTLSGNLGMQALLEGTDVTVAANTELIVDNSVNVHSITVAPEGKLTINDSKSLSTKNLTLLSSESGTATLLDNNSSPTLSATVQQHVTAGRNWYISSPINSAVYNILNRGTSVVEWNESLKAWDPKVTGTLTPGRGYIQVASSSPSVTGTTGTVDFEGITNSGDVSLTLYRSGSTQAGFNLVGNPYPSYLDWKLVAAANTNVLPTIWLRTKDSSGNYAFATVNVASYLDNPTNFPIISSNSANTEITTYIPPMQAYWVRLNAKPLNTTYTVSNAMRTHRDNSGNTFKAPQQKNSNQQLLRLQISNGTNTDETVFYSSTNATNGLDNYDSPKMANSSSLIPDIYTLADGEKLVINGVNSIPYNTEVPLGFSTQRAGTFSLKVTQFYNFDTGAQVMLKDYLNPQSPVNCDLTNGSEYSFSSDVSSNNISRFALSFKAPSTITGVNTNNNDDVWISNNTNGQITVNGLSDITSVVVYNEIGQHVAAQQMTSTVGVLGVRLIPGVYFVTLTTNERQTTKKIIIN